jgi:hypothetical protein
MWKEITNLEINNQNTNYKIKGEKRIIINKDLDLLLKFYHSIDKPLQT